MIFKALAELFQHMVHPPKSVEFTELTEKIDPVEGVTPMLSQNNVRLNVLELTKQYPEVKNNYNTLLMYYWKFYDGVTMVDYIVEATSPESITRAFRRLVSQGEIVLPEEVKQERAEAENFYKSEFSSL